MISVISSPVFLKPPTNRPPNTDHQPNDHLPLTKWPPTKCTDHRPTDLRPIRRMMTRNSTTNFKWISDKNIWDRVINTVSRMWVIIFWLKPECVIVSATRRSRDIKLPLCVGPCSEKFNIVSNDHGRTQKCDFCISVCKTNFTDHHKPGGCLSNNWKPSFLPFLFASSIYLAYIFEASYYTLVMSVSKKSSADLSEFEKYVVSNCIQYTVLEIQFWSVKCTTVTVRYAKISKISFPCHHQAMLAIATIRLDINKPLQNAFKRI